MELLFPILENVCVPTKQFSTELEEKEWSGEQQFEAAMFEEYEGMKEIFNGNNKSKRPANAASVYCTQLQCTVCT